MELYPDITQSCCCKNDIYTNTGDSRLSARTVLTESELHLLFIVLAGLVMLYRVSAYLAESNLHPYLSH